MSADYLIGCSHCKVYTHLGQSMGGTYSFGFGTEDVKTQAKIMEFIANHCYHQRAAGPGAFGNAGIRTLLQVFVDHPEGFKQIDLFGSIRGFKEGEQCQK